MTMRTVVPVPVGTNGAAGSEAHRVASEQLGTTARFCPELTGTVTKCADGSDIALPPGVTTSVYDA